MLRFVKGSLRQLSCSWIWLRLWRESGSYKIIENAGLMGLPIPAVITKAVDILKQRSEGPEGQKGTEHE